MIGLDSKRKIMSGIDGVTAQSLNIPKGIREMIASFDRALTAEEVAGLLAVSPQMIRLQARSGVIPSFRIGTSVRFDPKKLCEWYESQ
jgi:excisionase family DNA binding protein